MSSGVKSMVGRDTTLKEWSFKDLSASLKQRAEKMEAEVERHFVDANGVVYTCLAKETMLPPTNALFAGMTPEVKVEGVSPADLYMHENCGMCTGAYMQAMTLNHRLTGSQSALSAARRGLKALRHIYDMGRKLEPGFFPKIYGGRFSTQTSTDQVLYAVSAMDNFYDLADSNEKKMIREMIPSMIEFWVGRGYRLTYFHVKDMLWPLDRFPSLLALARKYSDREIFKTEYERLLPLTESTDCSRIGPKLAGKIPPDEFEEKTRCWFMCHSGDAMTMSAMQYDILLRNSPNDPMRAKWLAALRQMWDESKLTLTPDGRCLSQALVGMDDMTARRTLSHLDGNQDMHGAKTSWSTMLVRGGLLAMPHLPERREEILEKTALVLSSLDVGDLTYYDEPERFRPEHRYKTKMLSGDAVANWLWAYWLAKSLTE